MNIDQAQALLSDLSFQKIIQLLVALLVLFVVVRCARALSESMMQKFPDERMTILQLSTAGNFFIYFVGACCVIYIVFRPTRDVWLWFLTTGFLAVGFAVKDLFASLVACVMLLLDKPFQVGDRIMFKNVQGEVVEIGIRSVKLRSSDKGIITIPNQCFLSELVSSRSAGTLGMVTSVETHINSADVSLPKAKEILEQAARKSPYVNLHEKILITGKEVLAGPGFPLTILTTKCGIKDARTEEAFQMQFLVDAYQGLRKEHHELKSNSFQM